jgi:hypothetical protein
MAPARHAQFRLHQDLGALPRIEEYAGTLTQLGQFLCVLPQIEQFLGTLPQIEHHLGTLPQIEHHLGALPQIERDLAELINCLPRGSRDIEIDDEDVKQACVFLCRAVRQDDLRLVNRHVWVKHFKKIGLPSCIKIAQLPGDVSSVTDQIQKMFEASNILGAPSRAATGVIVVAARSAAQALAAERGRRK